MYFYNNQQQYNLLNPDGLPGQWKLFRDGHPGIVNGGRLSTGTVAYNFLPAGNGASYAASVSQGTCSITNVTGTVNSADIINIDIDCQ